MNVTVRIDGEPSCFLRMPAWKVKSHPGGKLTEVFHESLPIHVTLHVLGTGVRKAKCISPTKLPPLLQALERAFRKRQSKND